MKRQKSVPEDLTKVEEDRSSPTELDICRTFEEEVCSVLFFTDCIGSTNLLVVRQNFTKLPS